MVNKLQAIDVNQNARQDMLDILDLLRERVEDGTCQALAAVEMRRAGNCTMLHEAGDLRYSEIIGYLELAKMDLYARAAGLKEEG